MKTPIAFIIFNRPDTARRVFEEIRKAQPPLLLLVADGPRPGHAHDAEQCARTRAIVDQVDWQCEIRKNYSDINLGCKKRVASGLDWVFSEVEEVIILEDDCLPHPTFFQFCEELLQKYRNDERIGHIGGSNLQFGRQRGPYSYYFSRYIHVWGWASWRRAWEGYDPDLALWPKAREEKRLQQFLGVLSLVGYWTNIFEKVYQNEIDTWDYQWSFHCWAQGRLVIIPNVNLISNIGYGADATHLIGQSIFGNMKTEAMQFPLAHPPLFLRDSAADKYTEKYHFFSPSPALRILLRLRYSFLMCLWALAKRLGVNLHTDGRLLHLFTGKKISKEYSKARR